MRIDLRSFPARLAGTRDLSATVREFLLQPQQAMRLAWDPGAHVQVHVPVNGQDQLRHYSLVGEPDGQHLRIAVKRMDGGRGGSRAMWELAVGDPIHVSEPQNHFALDLAAPACLLVAGGIGITPLVLMAMRLAQRAARQSHRVRMLYGARSRNELVYAGQLGPLAGLQLQTFVDEEGERPDFATEIAALPPGGQVYACGPVPMLEALRRAWDAAARPIADLRFETFGSSGRFPAQPFVVRVPRHGLEIAVPTDATLLDMLERAGVETLSDCRRGECGLCAMDVLAVDGEIDHRDVFLSEQEKRDSHKICTCVSRVVGSITLDSAYRPDA